MTVCEHEYSAWTEQLAATCESIGYETKECSKCGQVEYKFTAASGHTLGAYSVIVDTCASKMEMATCDVCGETTFRAVGVTKEHAYVDDTCVVCGKEYIAFNVTFNVNGGEGEFSAQRIEAGQSAVEPEGVPTKTGYNFIGWYNGASKWAFNSPINADLELVAEWEAKKYAITFVVDGQEYVQEVAYDEVPVFAGSTDKAADAQYTYTFAGWDIEPVAVTGEATYTAKYTETLRNYNVTFVVNGEEFVQEVAYGEVPVFAGSTDKAADAQYTYTFAGWDTEIVAVTGATTYTATYTTTTNKYNVTFVVDGEEFVQEVAYGEVPEFTGSTDKAEDEQYTYTFAGWDKEVSAVTGDVVYTAVYDKEEKVQYVPVEESISGYTIAASTTGVTVANGGSVYGGPAGGADDPAATLTGVAANLWDYYGTNGVGIELRIPDAANYTSFKVSIYFVGYYGASATFSMGTASVTIAGWSTGILEFTAADYAQAGGVMTWKTTDGHRHTFKINSIVATKMVEKPTTPALPTNEQKAFNLFADSAYYSEYKSGKPTGVTATNNTITVTATSSTQSDANGRRGFRIANDLVDAWLQLGFKSVTFTVTSEASHFYVFSVFWNYTESTMNMVFPQGEGFVRWDTSLDGPIYANGGTVTIDLEKWYQQSNQEMRNGLQFAFFSDSNKTAYPNDVSVVFSNIQFS